MTCTLKSGLVLSVLLSLLTISLGAQSTRQNSQPELKSIRVTSIIPKQEVTYVPNLLKFINDKGVEKNKLNCNDINENTVLISANIIPSINDKELETLTDWAKREYGNSIQVKRLRPKYHSAWLILNGQKYEIEGTPTDPFAQITVWQEVEKKNDLGC